MALPLIAVMPKGRGFVSLLQMLYRYVLDDLYEYPTLEKEVKELQKLLRMQRRQ